MNDSIRARQLPGRQEALRLAMGKPSTPLLRHIAGLDKVHAPLQDGTVLTMLREHEKLTDDERATLPF